MTHKGTITLETERLILRRFTLDDAENVFQRWSNSAENSRFVMKSPHTSVTETKNLLRAYIRDYDKPDFYMWGIVYEGELIGYICGNEINEEIKSVCIGYCITKSCWNNGITTEATKALIDFFFSLGFNRIFSYHNPLNPASGKVMQKCGMQFEGRIRGGSMLAGKIYDCLQYAILAEDYFGASKLPQSYIMNLRKYVGHIPLIMNGAGVIIENEREEILLGQRRDNGCWTHAGGSSELGESCEETARRELFEEMGLIANTLELLGVFSGKDTHYIYPNGDEVYNVAVIYTCCDWSGTPAAQEEEVAELRWFPIDEIPDNISPPDMTIYKAYLEKRRTII
ncbi:MAG: GNAT family N-acetyltransferase [Clostridiales bacterium]|jgi:RimJ/RimL family protein N-acetyltransferase/8-oxo-dGTP pyrophosphatase MutT (NUDIX family)|nr:GNAT family N-acetyltransferase [Clostridiales bacterium]